MEKNREAKHKQRSLLTAKIQTNKAYPHYLGRIFAIHFMQRYARKEHICYLLTEKVQNISMNREV